MPRVAPVSPSDPQRGPRAPGARETFGRWRRIAAPSVFREALATRPRARGAFFDILCLLAPPSGSIGPVSRLGLVVPKRICRSAARRNWIKRMVRESFRRGVPTDVPLDCVVRLRRDLTPGSAAAARCELGDHWRKVIAQ